MATLKRLLLSVSMCCLIATANAAPLDDAKAANDRDGYAQTVKILRPLAEQGYAAAQTNLGTMYAEGQGVTQDYQEALKWYRLAAAERQESAIVNLKSPEMVAAAQNSTTEQSQYTATKPNKGKSPPSLWDTACGNLKS